jgi:hypothetical protein
MPSAWQYELLDKLSPGKGMAQGVVPWDSNDPAGAPNLVSQLWYAAPESSRQALDQNRSFSEAMLGPRTTAPGLGPQQEFTPPPFGQGRWKDMGGSHHQWRFNALPLPELQSLKAEGRLPTEIDMSFFEPRPQQQRPQPTPFGTMSGRS